MNKRQFEAFFNDNVKNMPLEAQMDLLDKIKDVWIPNLSEKKLKNYTYCAGCRKYIKTKTFSQLSKKEWVKNVCVYHDAGYGDSDRYADVLYDFLYSVCPNCGHRKIISKYPLTTENEHERG